jgi:PylC-like, N-terminal domain
MAARAPAATAGQPHVRVLVTGAGGPAAVSVMKSLQADPTVELLAADIDPWAAGLYLVPPEARAIIPRGDDPALVSAVFGRCVSRQVDVVIPTVDTELRPLAQARGTFAGAGIRLLLAPDEALAVTLDKLALARRCAGTVRVPRTELLAGTSPGGWQYPVVVKPRRRPDPDQGLGSGRRRVPLPVAGRVDGSGLARDGGRGQARRLAAQPAAAVPGRLRPADVRGHPRLLCEGTHRRGGPLGQDRQDREGGGSRMTGPPRRPRPLAGLGRVLAAFAVLGAALAAPRGQGPAELLLADRVRRAARYERRLLLKVAVPLALVAAAALAHVYLFT